MAPGALPRPGRVPEQRLSVPRISPSVAAALRNFSWLEADDLGFLHQRLLIGERGGRGGL